MLIPTKNRVSPFKAEQIKSADSITYDNNGEIIPLSERFNTQKKDVRWNMEDEENAITSDRSGVISGNSSSGNLLEEGKEHLNHEYLAQPKDVAKLRKNAEDTKIRITNIVNKGDFIKKGDYRVVIVKDKDRQWILFAFDYIT